MRVFGYYCTIRDGMQADTAAKSVIDQQDKLKTYRLRVRRSRFSRSLASVLAHDPFEGG
jgi:hypothetical protein